MSASANLVYANFVWRIEAVDPTASTIGKDRLHAIDPRAIHGTDPRTSSGLTRGFVVTWKGCGPQNVVGGAAICDTSSSRFADHAFEVAYYYTSKLKWEDAQKLLLSDRHDGIKALRYPSSWVGYDDSHTTTDIGLENRTIESEEIEQTDDYVVLRQQWRCAIEETE
jgi:hypothetical protein